MAQIHSSKATYLNTVESIRYKPSWLSESTFVLIAVCVCGLLLNYTNLAIGDFGRFLLFVGSSIVAYHGLREIYVFYKRRNSNRFLITPNSRHHNTVLGQLSLLPQEFSVFHNIELPNGHHTHFVVSSPFGIFSLRIKHLNGVIGYDGECLTQNGTEMNIGDLIHHTHHQAKELQEYVNSRQKDCILIKPLLVLSPETIFTPYFFCEIDEVIVLHYYQLNNYLLKYSSFKPTINAAEVNQTLLPLFTA